MGSSVTIVQQHDGLTRLTALLHPEAAGFVLTALDATATGLSSSEAAVRLSRLGPNSLPGAKPRPAILRLLAQFNNALIYFMLAGAGAAAALGHYVDTGVILAVVIDAEGRPICTEMVPGNTADVKVLMPIVTRLRTRFGITRSCVVADRGMISAGTIAALEELGMEYILGARERTSNVIRDVVLADTAPMVPLVLERQAGDTQLWVKEVRVGKGADAQRYVVTLNEAEARKDKADRQAIIDGLQTQLKKGDKALVGNSAYRRYLKASGKTFEIDMGKLADEARYDGISVLRTNARITPLQAVIRYRDLLQVEALFRVAKASFDTRPIFHQSDAAIRGHVFVSFLALTLAKELTRLCQEKGLQPEWQPLLNDLDRLQEATIEKDGKVITTRTHVSGQVGNVFKATGIALPANISELPPRT